LLLELLEDRNLLSYGLWLVSISGLPGDTPQDQVAAARTLVHNAQLDGPAQNVRVLDRIGVGDTFLILTPPDATAQGVMSEVQPLPGVRFLGPYDPGGGGVGAAQNQPRPTVPGQWVVQVEGFSGTPADQVVAFQRQLGPLADQVKALGQLGQDGLFLLQTPAGTTSQQLAATLAAVAPAASIEPNYNDLTTQLTPNDPLYSSLWGLHNTGQNVLGQVGIAGDDIKAPEAWNVSTGSTQVVVGDIDTGIDYTNPDLINEVWVNQREIPTLPAAPGLGIGSRLANLTDFDGDGLITFADLNYRAPDGSYPNQGPGKITAADGGHVITAADILRPMDTTVIGGQRYDLGTGGWAYPGNTQDGDTAHPNDFIGWNFVASNNNPLDDYGHGTHTAGTLGAEGDNGQGVVGVNWHVQIMAVKFLNSFGSGTNADAIAAINFATEKNREGANIKLTSNSWGGGGFDVGLQSAIQASGDRGMLFVAAAGNNNSNNDLFPFYPASYNLPNLIAVAASDNRDTRASFSNYGATTVALAAPGVNVLSTLPKTGPLSDPSGYGYLSGTSMATPHVAGVAALAWSVAPNATYLDIKNAILGGVDKVPALNGLTLTGGRLNAFKTLQQLGLVVVRSTPAIGEVVTTRPVDFVLRLSDAYDPATVTAGALTVNGIPADSFTLTDATTVTFHFNSSPVTAEGPQSLDIPADNGIQRASDHKVLHAFHATFYYATVQLAVTATEPANNSVAPIPFTHLKVHFNRPYDPSTLSPGNLALSEGTVTAATPVDATTAEYTLSGIIDEGPLSFTIAAGALTDVNGTPMLPYAGHFVAEIGLAPLPAATPVLPLGGLVYQTKYPGRTGIDSRGDTDHFSITVNAGEQITVLVHPTGATLQPTIQLYDPGNNPVGGLVTAPGAGKEALLQSAAATAGGPYTIAVGGASGTLGDYTVQVFLNAALQGEAHGGAANSTLATAQDLGGAFGSLGGDAGRAAVLGTLKDRDNYYSFPLTAGQSVSLGAVQTSPTSTTLFGPPQTYPVKLDPVAVAAADLRHSGIIDLVVANSVFNSVSVLLGNGDGTFGPATDYTVSATPFDVAVGDVYGDGIPDIVVADSTAGRVTILRGNGDGTFGNRTDILVGGNPRSVALADLNGDNHLDIVTANSDANTVTVLLNKGDGTFNSQLNYTVGFGPYSVAVGDVNGDGKPDIVTANYFGSNVTILRGNGDGTFGNRTDLPAGGGPRSVALADLNGDGKLDIVTANYAAYTVSVLLNKGDGTFNAHTDYAVDTTPERVVVGDLNGDGKPDIVTGNGDSFFGSCTVLLGNGDGTFGHRSDLPSPSASYGVALADVNGDGSLDLINTNYFVSNSVSVRFNNLTRVSLELVDAHGTALALARTDATNLNAVINNFVAPADGTYYAHVKGIGRPDYNLVVTRNADFSTEPNDDFLTGSAQYLVQDPSGQETALGYLSATDAQDVYEVSAGEGQTLTVGTTTPFPGPGDFANGLDPMVNLYGPDGSLVASDDNSAPDGRNALLTYTVPAGAGGLYFIQVQPSPLTDSPTTGEYTLMVTGSATADATTVAPFTVVSTSPADKALLGTNPTTLTVTFNHGILMPSLTPSALLVDGRPATAFTVVNATTVTFTLPSLPNQLTHPVTLARGAVEDDSGTPLTGYSGEFYVNTVPPNVIASSIQDSSYQSDVVPAGPGGTLTYTVQFSEPLNPATVTAASFSLRGLASGRTFTADSFTYIEDTSTLTLNYSGLGDENYELRVFGDQGSGRVVPHDLFGLGLDGETVMGGRSVWPLPPGHSGNGVPGGDFVVHFSVDVAGPVPYPTPLLPANPPGSLIYQGTPAFSTLLSAADTDSFTLAVNAGQTVTVLVHPLGTTLQPTVQLADPSGTGLGSAVAAGPGQEVVLQTVPAATDGTYTITVGSAAGSGAYTVQILLNTALQAQAHGGPGDGSRATAQDLGPSFIPLPKGASRGAVVGNFKGSDDFYSFHLDAGQAVTLAAVLGPNPPLYGSPALLSTGTGQFGGYSVAVGDVNGDGKPDLVVANLSSGTVSVLLGNGDGTFQAPRVYAAGIDPSGVALADLRGTGRPDIIVSNYFNNTFTSGGVTVLLNNGDGTFGTPTTYTTGGFNSGAVAVGDLRGTGKQDIVVANFYDTHFNSGNISVLLNNGNGTFGPHTDYPAGRNPRGLALADLRGTGKKDIIVGDQSSDLFFGGGLSVLLNNGSGTGFTRTAYTTGGFGTGGVAVADLRGTGKLDIVAANGSGVSVFPGNGNGTFGPRTDYATGFSPTSVAVGDVNGDGKADILTANSDGTVSVLLGNGSGGFGPHTDYPAGSSHSGFSDLVLADFLGNHLLDVATANSNSNTVSVLLNQTSSLSMQLQDAAGAVLAAGTPGPSNVDLAVRNFVAPADGTYCARFFGVGINRSYTLVVTRNAAFDLHPNNSFATAEDITGTAGALGYVNLNQGAAVVPGSLANTPGDAITPYPFDIGTLGGPSMRYQQIYSHTQFATGGIIDDIRFRQSASFGSPFSASGIDIKISLGYAATTVATASPTFANNIGPGFVTVFDGLLDLSSTATGGSPRPFDILVNFAHLFNYDPTRGDLLLDISLRNAPHTTPIDASDAFQQGSTIRIYATNVNAPTGLVGSVGEGRPYGLVTQFDIESGSTVDYYKVAAAAGQTLTFVTATPSDGPGEFRNTLSPHIQLYDPSKNPVAAGTKLADGRNETITYTAPAAGVYFITITSDTGGTGEYFLDPVTTAVPEALAAPGPADAGQGRPGLVSPGSEDSTRGDLVGLLGSQGGSRTRIEAFARPGTLADGSGQGSDTDAGPARLLAALLGPNAGADDTTPEDSLSRLPARVVHQTFEDGFGSTDDLNEALVGMVAENRKE
jgi:subtilisin family serine protease